MTYCRICNNGKRRGIGKGRSENRNSKAKEQPRAKQSKERSTAVRLLQEEVNMVVAVVVDSGATSKKEGEVT